MTAILQLNSRSEREKAHKWIDLAPVGSRVSFKRPGRTTPQNERMWVLLTAIATQCLWHGQHYAKEDWKDYFMHLLQGGRFMPSEDGGMVPIGRSTSKLDKADHSDLTMLMEAFAARHGIDLGEPAKVDA